MENSFMWVVCIVIWNYDDVLVFVVIEDYVWVHGFVAGGVCV